jgi:hypothetical protein
VRKLISEWIEAKLQREIAGAPEMYKGCAHVVLAFTLREGAAPDVAVRFES